MHLHQFARVAMATAVLALPTAALAAPDQNSGPYNNNQCTQWNNNGQCVQWNNNNGRNQRDGDDRNGNGRYGNNGYGNNNGYGRSGQLDAVVSSFSPYNLYLQNGTHVSLHNGTVINPTGINLTGGQRVHISGYWNGDGSFSANEIDVQGRGGWR
jgi:hypothetical protein